MLENLLLLLLLPISISQCHGAGRRRRRSRSESALFPFGRAPRDKGREGTSYGGDHSFEVCDTQKKMLEQCSLQQLLVFKF